jgi:uncharacterized protein (DUF736 family)
MSGQYPPGGVLFPNRRKTSDKHPDFTGNLEISRDLLTELVEAAKGGKEIKMDVSAWTKTGKSGQKFLSLTARKPFVSSSNGNNGASNNNVDDEIPF